MLNVVIVHTGYKDYLKYNLEITSKNNNVYLLGDESVKKLESIDNVTFVNIDKYMNSEMIKKYSESFKNYSKNDKKYELFCFLRIFIVKMFMEEYNLTSIFHLDSDCILFYDINNYPFEKEVAYQNNLNEKDTDMCDSVHNGLLNIDFCNKFENLFKEIYVNNDTKLIDKKIEYHKGIFSGGGICDMTFYYIMRKNNIVDVENLANPKLIDGKKYVFIDNIKSGEGFNSRNQYEKNNSILNSMIKLFKDEEGNIYIKDKKTGKKFYPYNIHFQGGNKKFINQDLINIINDKEKSPELYNENLEILLFSLLAILLIFIIYKLYKNYHLIQWSYVKNLFK